MPTLNVLCVAVAGVAVTEEKPEAVAFVVGAVGGVVPPMAPQPALVPSMSVMKQLSLLSRR